MLQLFVMLALEFFSWWYGPGWALLTRNMLKRQQNVSHMFSVPILLRTMFAPWKRIVSYPGAGLDAHLRAMLDNLVSRFIGFTVRLLVLFAALIILIVVGVVAVIEIVAWPLLPIAIPVSFIKGLS